MDSKVVNLTATEKTDLLWLARTALTNACQRNDADPNEILAQPKFCTDSLLRTLPCFVTLESKSGRLRGCIGSMVTNQTLAENVYDFAIKAGFEDPRFAAIGEEELRDLVISITVLGPLEHLPSISHLRIGEHGLWVGKGHHHGVLLASVAVEWGWTPEEFLAHTCEKAGLDPELAETYEKKYFSEVQFSEPGYSSPR